MDENKDIRIPVKRIPAFTVLKNGSILKNIFLLSKPPPFSTQESAIDAHQESDEEILLVGRHPLCNITLEHPSISRYHLRIHSNPSSQMLSIIDLSSVHGTWVSGKRVWPGVPVKLKEGDTVRMGVSSRIYELHWVPLSQAFDVDDPFVPAVYTFKEGEEDTNQDETCSSLEKLETHPSLDDLESLNLSLSNQTHHSSLKKLNPFTSSVPNCSNSSCDDTDVEHSSPSKENGKIFSTALVQPQLVVSGTISTIENSDILNKSDDQSNWLTDNMRDEFELHNHGTIKEDSFAVPNCSKTFCDDTEVEHSSPWKTGNESGEILATVSVQAPLVISETISALEISDSLNKSEDQSNGSKDNMSDELKLHNHETIKEDSFAVPNCSKSFCDDTEVEHSSPWKTGNESGEILATVSVQAPIVISETISAPEISDSLNKSEDQSNWANDNMSHESELHNHGTNKEDSFAVQNCSKWSYDDTEVEHSSPWKTGNEIGEILATVSVQAPLVVSESISATEISDSLNKSEDQSNWSRDIMSNEFEQLSHEAIKEDSFAVPKWSYDDIEVEHSSPWKTGNESAEFIMSNEFEQLSHEALKEDSFAVPNCSKWSYIDVEHSSPWKTGNESTEVIMSNEFEQLSHEAIKEDSFAVPNRSKWSYDDIEVEHSSPWKTDNESAEILATVSVQAPLVVSETISATEIFDSLSKSEDLSNWSRDIMSNEFEQLGHGTIKEDPLSVPDCSNDTEVEHSSPWKTGNEIGETFATVSVQAPLVVSETISATESFDGLNKSEDIGRDYEPVNQQKIENSSVPVALFNGVYRDENVVFMPHKAGSKEVNVGCEFEQMNQTKIMDESASVVLFDDIYSKVDNNVLCTSIESRGKEVDTGVKLELFDQETPRKDPVLVALPDGTDMDQERTFTPDIPRAKEVYTNLEAMKNVSVSTTRFDSLDGNEVEIFTPDKENNNPNACSVKSLKKRWKEDEHKQSNHCTMSKKAISPNDNEEKDIFGFSKKLFTSVEEGNSVFTTDGEKFVSDSLLQRSPNTTDKVDPFVHHEEVLFSSLEQETKSRPMKMEGSYNSINCPQTVQKVIDSSHNFLGGEKKGWTMVVDTNSLLDDKSLKHLKLLQGLTRTQLFVPKFVMRELMDIKGQHDHSKKITKNVSLALKWIAECMVNTRWWIHVDDEILHSSEARPEVLETALHLRKEVTYRNVIILSNDLTLKIKAMAEGVVCEAAEDFHRSLVNPFSKRFMWVGSLARGPTWSCVDDDVLRQKYQGHMLKGLKLLAHMTNFW